MKHILRPRAPGSGKGALSLGSETPSRLAALDCTGTLLYPHEVTVTSDGETHRPLYSHDSRAPLWSRYDLTAQLCNRSDMRIDKVPGIPFALVQTIVIELHK